MIKEHIKSCLLFLLITSSIVLTINIWFNGKLWPSGYNFFSNITNLLEIKNNKTYYLSKENVSYPEKIIINGYETRNMYYHTSKEYNEFSTDVLDILKYGLSKTSFTSVSEDEWNNALKIGSVYISYPVAYDSDLLCKILEINPLKFDVESSKEFIIVPSIIGNSSNIILYAKDYSSNKVYNTIFEYNLENINKIIENYSKDSLNLLPYSFELYFDETEDQSIEQKVIIDPTITLKLENMELPVLKSKNYLNNFYNSPVSKKMLNAFGFNSTNTKTSQLDNNNTAVYVENYSTIKVYNNGFVEYKSIDPSKGITLTNSSSDVYENFIACIEFVNKVWDSTFPDEPLNINLTSDIIDTDNGSGFKITMDYYVNGCLTVLENNTHAIEITVNNGKITEYKQLFNKFYTDSSDETVTVGSSIEALDSLYADKTLEKGKISELNVVYSKSGNKLIPYWAAKLDGKNRIINR